jgi:hypothetical protein
LVSRGWAPDARAAFGNTGRYLTTSVLARTNSIFANEINRSIIPRPIGVAAVEPALSFADGRSVLIRRSTGASVKDSNVLNGFSAPATDVAALE